MILRSLHWAAVALVIAVSPPAAGGADGDRIDFNRDIRGILSNKCFTCHGPDEDNREAGLRLDLRDSATGELDSGSRALVPGQPEQSELLARVRHADEDLRMPPGDGGKQLTADEIERLQRWIAQGAGYAEHWSYAVPQRPTPPAADAPQHPQWLQQGIDRFLLAKMRQAGMQPSPQADRRALIRRVSLDLTGLPPTMEEVEQFVADQHPEAYERLVDRLLAKPAFGEHWARKWLDLARYADSAGYADDPPRTIWAYRDWVIRSINSNQPFDQFSIEQLAGDLLPTPSDEQLVATAFHRNTLTNNEGGTNDEEYRNVAIVDRVNTTMAVWMGTTAACAQCHNHKYDPISQEEYFRLFAVFNNCEDADRRNESPLQQVWTPAQRQQQDRWRQEIAALRPGLDTPTPELAAAQAQWERQFQVEPDWQLLTPQTAVSKQGRALQIREDGSLFAAEASATDTYTISLVRPQPAGQPLTALRIEALTDAELPANGPGHADGNFVLSRVSARLRSAEDQSKRGRFLRITLPGSGKFLSLAEVQVISGGENVAPAGQATQSSTDFGGDAARAIDGNTSGAYERDQSTTHTAASTDPWWELDLKQSRDVEQVVVWNRTDNALHTRLNNFRVALLDDQRRPVWEQSVKPSPNPSAQWSLGGPATAPLAAAFADYAQDQFAAASVVGDKADNGRGWAVGGAPGQPHWLVLTFASPLQLAGDAQLELTLEQVSKLEQHTLGALRISATSSKAVAAFAQLPAPLLDIVRQAASDRSPEEARQLADHYRSIAPALAGQRQQLQQLEKQLASAKPATTVPILRELSAGARRTTKIQRRGNFLETGAEVQPGLPAALHRQGQIPEQPDRLALARWIMDPANPLTARVTANRYWEAVFGRGLVVTSEEFGSQGEPPSHPELLDFLATELLRMQWNRKQFLKSLVMTAAYRQSSAVTAAQLERDPDNVLLARGPRVRLSAEMIRDQALAVSGLLSDKMHGPPVKPPQPSLGLKAAFGSGTDWQASKGEDRYRRGLYTTWRRSSPYPSMAAFDAPNREVCTIRRDRTNTPLQALVTLNDPVYVEAAQALARRMAAHPGSVQQRAAHGFALCLARPPQPAELSELTQLYSQALEQLAAAPDDARRLATEPLGPAPPDADLTELAAWTVVGNVLLNLDEMFMKR